MDSMPFEGLGGLGGLASPRRTPVDIEFLSSPETAQSARFGGAFDLAGPDPLQGGMNSPYTGMSPVTSLLSGCPPIFKNSPNRSSLFPRSATAGMVLTPGALLSNPIGSTILSPLPRASLGDLPLPGNPQGGVPVEFATTAVSNLELPSRRVLQFRSNFTPTGTSSYPSGAPAPETETTYLPRNETALGLRTSTNGFAAIQQATMMIETSYTQPMLPMPRDLLQPPPALLLDSKPSASPHQSKQPVRMDMIRPCAQAMGEGQDLPPTRLRRQTARAAALYKSLNIGHPAPGSAGGATPVATRKQPDIKRAGIVARCSMSILPTQAPGEACGNGGPGSATKSNAQRPTSKCCCKKSKCLKLYCDCFATGNFCNGCGCHSCANLQELSGQVRMARDSILARNPYAFQPKISKGSKSGSFGAEHRSGCNCKKSHCKKKYCECFQAGAPCGQICKCENCHNLPEQLPPQQLPALVQDPVPRSNVIRRRGQLAYNSPGTPRVHPNGTTKGVMATTQSHATVDTSGSVVPRGGAIVQPHSVRASDAAFAAASETGGVRTGNSAATAAPKTATCSLLDLSTLPADASAVAAAIVAVNRKPTTGMDPEAIIADMQGNVLQLQPGTNIENTDHGRIVQTNRGTMILVPLTTEGLPALPSSACASETVTAASATAHGNIHVQWKQTDDGCIVAIPLSFDQVVRQQQELAAEGSRFGHHLLSTPQNNGNSDRGGPSSFQTYFDGAFIRNLAAATKSNDTRGGKEALVLSPQRTHHQRRDHALCFSPVLLTRGATRNLMYGQPLDVHIAGSSDMEDEAMEEQLQGLAEICMSAEDQASQHMLDSIDASEFSIPVPEFPEPSWDQGASLGTIVWPTAFRTTTTLVTDDAPDHTNYSCQHSSKVKLLTTRPPPPMTRSIHTLAAALPGEVLGILSPTRKRKGSVPSPPLPHCKGGASTRACRA